MTEPHFQRIPPTHIPTPPPALPIHHFRRVGRADPQREAIEGIMQQCYWRAHRASRCHFLEHLLVVGKESPLSAGLGIGEGRQGNFFLESYLDASAEQVIAQHAHMPIDRHTIVEIGSLVSLDRSASTHLMLLTIAWLKGYGAEWGIFTATAIVRDRLTNLGLPLFDLAPADPKRLGAQAQDWGSYYDADPRVTAARLSDARRLIEALEKHSHSNMQRAERDGLRVRIEGAHV